MLLTVSIITQLFLKGKLFYIYIQGKLTKCLYHWWTFLSKQLLYMTCDVTLNAFYQLRETPWISCSFLQSDLLTSKILCVITVSLYQTKFFFKVFVGHKSFLWRHWYHCFWWRLPRVSKLEWILSLVCLLACAQWIPRIHLWCDTCWLYRGQHEHGSCAFLIHIPVYMSASTDGGLGLEPMTVHAACSKHGIVDHSATPARLTDKTSLNDMRLV